MPDISMFSMWILYISNDPGSTCFSFYFLFTILSAALLQARQVLVSYANGAYIHKKLPFRIRNQNATLVLKGVHILCILFGVF
jgi:hypothetical protein